MDSNIFINKFIKELININIKNNVDIINFMLELKIYKEIVNNINKQTYKNLKNNNIDSYIQKKNKNDILNKYYKIKIYPVYEDKIEFLFIKNNIDFMFNLFITNIKITILKKHDDILFLYGLNNIFNRINNAIFINGYNCLRKLYYYNYIDIDTTTTETLINIINDNIIIFEEHLIQLPLYLIYSFIYMIYNFYMLNSEISNTWRRKCVIIFKDTNNYLIEGSY